MNKKKIAKLVLFALPFIAPLAQANEIFFNVNATTFGETNLSGILGFNTDLNAGLGNFDMFDLTVSGANGGASFPQYHDINGEYTQVTATASFTNNEVQFTQYLGITGTTERIVVDLLFANPVTAATLTDQIVSRTAQNGDILASDISYFNPITSANTIVGLSSISASISAVSVPSTLWLFASGLLGLGSLYKKKSQA